MKLREGTNEETRIIIGGYLHDLVSFLDDGFELMTRYGTSLKQREKLRKPLEELHTVAIRCAARIVDNRTLRKTLDPAGPKLSSEAVWTPETVERIMLSAIRLRERIARYEGDMHNEAVSSLVASARDLLALLIVATPEETKRANEANAARLPPATEHPWYGGQKYRPNGDDRP
jgi:hypothetical protein